MYNLHMQTLFDIVSNTRHISPGGSVYILTSTVIYIILAVNNVNLEV